MMKKKQKKKQKIKTTIMNIDFKFTGWERVSVPDEYKELVISKLKSGEITNANDLFNMDELYNKLDTEQLAETYTELHTSDNKGFATIEGFEDDGELLFANGLH